MKLEHYLLLAILILATASTAVAYVLYKETKTLKSDVSGLQGAISNSVNVFKTENGLTRAQIETIKLSEETANKMLGKSIKELESAFNVKIKDLKSYIEIETRYSKKVSAKGRDTVILQTIEKVYTIDNGVSGKLYTKGDSLFGTIVINDTVQITVSRGKRDKWWKLWEKRPSVTNAYMRNKDGTVTNLKSVIVVE